MKMTKVASSNINAIGYSEALKQLHVEFKNGKTFAYTDVSKEEFAALTASPSTGKHFNQNIKAVKECFEAVEGWQEDLIARQAEIIKQQAAKIESIQGQLNAAPCKERNKYLVKMSKLQADNELLREALLKITRADVDFDVPSEVWVIADEALEATTKN